MAGKAGYTGFTNIIADKVQFGEASGAKPVNKLLAGTVPVDLANLGGSASATLTVTITGAAVGDIVILNPSVSLVSPTGSRIIPFTARVSATNTVEITYDSAGTGNLASGDWPYLIIGYATS